MRAFFLANAGGGRPVNLVLLAVTSRVMERYDPENEPIPHEWMALDEGERIHMVEQFHRDADVQVPNLSAHATFHVIVENQLALPNQVVVRDTVQRLVREGLSRHDAIHAIASVLAVRVHELLHPAASVANSEAKYHAKLRRLTAKRWRSGKAIEE